MGQGTIVNEHNRDLFMLLGTVGKRVSQIITGLFEDSLTSDDQIDFANQLTQLANGFRHRLHRTPLVIDAKTTP
jgi:hypothetical protein